MMQRILVPLDGSECAERIMPLVGAFAAALHAEVRLVGVAGTESCSVPGDRYDRSNVGALVQPEERPARCYLEAAAARFTALGVPLVHVLPGISTPATLAGAAAHPTDLIALATQGRAGAAAWPLAGAARELLRARTVPLLLYALREPDAGAPSFRNLILPLDGTREAEGAIPAVSYLARRLGIPVTAVRPVRVHPFVRGRFPRLADDLEHGLRRQAEQYLAATVRRLQWSGVQAELGLLTGHPAICLARLARQNPGALIVVKDHSGPCPGSTATGRMIDLIVRSGSAAVLVLPVGWRAPAGREHARPVARPRSSLKEGGADAGLVD